MSAAQRSAVVVPFTGGRDRSEWKTARWGWMDGVQADRRLSDREKVIAAVLIRLPSDRKEPIYQISLACLASKLGKSESTVKRGLRALGDAGWITCSGRGRSVRMTIAFTFCDDLGGNEKSAEAAENHVTHSAVSEVENRSDRPLKQVTSDLNSEVKNRSHLTLKQVTSAQSPTPPIRNTRSVTREDPKPDHLNRFMAIYPRTRASGRQECEERFRKAVQSGVDPERIIRAAEQCRAESKRDRAPPAEYAENWLRKGRWADFEGSRPTIATTDQMAEKRAFFAQKIIAERYVAPTALNAGEARMMLAEKLVTEAQLRKAGIGW